MQVLEKILQTIEEDAERCLAQGRVDYAAGMLYAGAIIRSYMEDAPDTNDGKNNLKNNIYKTESANHRSWK